MPKKIRPDELRQFDAGLETFRNVNTLSDLLAMGPKASYLEKHLEKTHNDSLTNQAPQMKNRLSL